jgi:CheY-like chemotaxis protein
VKHVQLAHEAKLLGGISVIEASNGVEALAALEQRAVDLIVSDVVMPESLD